MGATFTDVTQIYKLVLRFLFFVFVIVCWRTIALQCVHAYCQLWTGRTEADLAGKMEVENITTDLIAPLRSSRMRIWSHNKLVDEMHANRRHLLPGSHTTVTTTLKRLHCNASNLRSAICDSPANGHWSLSSAVAVAVGVDNGFTVACALRTHKTSHIMNY